MQFEEQPLQYGTQIRCQSGEIFCHYDKSGKIVPQGKSSELSQAVRGWAESGFSPSATPASTMKAEGISGSVGPSTDIFVVYGHDTGAREQLELLLHKMGLNPIVLANLTPAGDTIIEKLERYLGEHSNVGFACVLLTPDDEGYPKGQSDAVRYRARQNVILELGMVLARLGRPRVAILRKQSVEAPSDINGLLYMPFEERVDEVASKLFRALRDAGYSAKESAL